MMNKNIYQKLYGQAASQPGSPNGFAGGTHTPIRLNYYTLLSS
jgi:hypothetical protein